MRCQSLPVLNLTKRGQKFTSSLLASVLFLTSVRSCPSIDVAEVSDIVIKQPADGESALGSISDSLDELKFISNKLTKTTNNLPTPDREKLTSGGIGAILATLFTSLVFGKKVLSKNKTIKNLNDKISGEKPRDADSLEGTQQLKEQLEETVETQKQLKLELENARKTDTQLQSQLKNVETAIQNDIYTPVEIVKGRHVHMDDQGVPEGWNDWYQKKKTEQRDTSRIPKGIVARRVDLLNTRPCGYVSVCPEYHENYAETRSTPFSNLDTSQNSVESDLYARFVGRTSFNDDEKKYLAEIEEALTEFVSSEEWTHIKDDFYQMIGSLPDGHPDTEEQTFTEPYLLPLQYWLLKFTSLSSNDENYQTVSSLYFGYGKKALCCFK